MIKYRVRQAVKKGNIVRILFRATGTTGSITKDSELPMFELVYIDNILKKVLDLGTLGQFDISRMMIWELDATRDGFFKIHGMEISSNNYREMEFYNIMCDNVITREQIYKELGSMECFKTNTEDECL